MKIKPYIKNNYNFYDVLQYQKMETHPKSER